jgi:hypothetical protein
MPSSRAMAVTLASWLGNMPRAAWMISGGATVGRPPKRLRARAAARPSRVPDDELADELG